MKKTLIIVLACLAALVGLFYTLNAYIYHEKQGDPSNREQSPSEAEGNQSQTGKRTPPQDPMNAIYVIDGQPVELSNGVSEAEAAPDSAIKVVTKYFGNAVKADLDKDGREDTVFLLTQSMGGTGTFYYVVAALNTEGGYIGSEALYLGDRIAPQTTEFRDGQIVVNYADRKSSDSFATPPSVAKSIWLKLDPKTMQFGEVVKDFEGEADPNKMTLGMKSWTWIKTVQKDSAEISPRAGKQFTVTFASGGKFFVKTDCNSVGGTYVVKGSAITLDQMMTTLMFCEGSQEGEFTAMLGQVSGYHFTSRGELVFDLKGGGSATFR